MVEEAEDVGPAEVARVPFAVEQDEPADPFGVAGAGFGPAEVGVGELAELIEQTGGGGGGFHEASGTGGWIYVDGCT